MVTYRFFRLAAKPRSAPTAGRRYYRLVSYPQDICQVETAEEAMEYAAARRYAAALTGENQWVILNEKARQCVQWHEAGKGGYVHVY